MTRERYLAYMRGYNAERRRKAKAAGLCLHCNAEPARPGLQTCAECGKQDSLRHPD